MRLAPRRIEPVPITTEEQLLSTADHSRRPLRSRLSRRTLLVTGALATPLAATAPALADGPRFALSSGHLGNTFSTRDQVAVSIETTASALTWRLADVDGKPVRDGTAHPEGSTASIALGTMPPGWYTLDVTAQGADGASVQRSTDLAVLPPRKASDERVGLCTHFAQSTDPALIPLLRSAGFGYVRDEAYWNEVETEAGSFDLPSKVTTFTTGLRDADMGFLQVLAYGNERRGAAGTPDTEAAREAFAAYASACVGMLQRENAAFEVWNEWNLVRPGAPENDTSARGYVDLLAATATRVRSDHEDVTLLGPALATTDGWESWVDDFIGAGGLDHIDGFSMHPYSFAGEPEAFWRIVAAARQKLDAAGHERMPIWITEGGWFTATSDGVSERAQARDLVRAELLSLARSIPRYTVYDAVDDGTDAAEKEHRFGLLRHRDDPRGAYAPKPGFVAQATLLRQIAGRGALGEHGAGEGVFAVRFGALAGEPEGTLLQAMWAAEPRPLSISANGEVAATNLYGSRTSLRPDGTGRVRVSIGPDPVFLSGPIGDHVEDAA